MVSPGLQGLTVKSDVCPKHLSREGLFVCALLVAGRRFTCWELIASASLHLRKVSRAVSREEKHSMTGCEQRCGHRELRIAAPSKKAYAHAPKMATDTPKPPCPRRHPSLNCAREHAASSNFRAVEPCIVGTWTCDCSPNPSFASMSLVLDCNASLSFPLGTAASEWFQRLRLASAAKQDMLPCLEDRS